MDAGMNDSGMSPLFEDYSDLQWALLFFKPPSERLISLPSCLLSQPHRDCCLPPSLS